jgi:4-hydroxyacetophenone monooxygenase
MLNEVSGADIVPLTMSLVQMTGDLAWLDRLAPHVRGPWDYSQNVPTDLVDEIRARAQVVSRLCRILLLR